MKSTGTLFLVPTFLNEELPLEQQSIQIISQHLSENPLIVVEEHKIARRRWIHSGLSREWIDKFVLLNEHQVDFSGLLQALKNGTHVFLMCDSGLPAFFDPGQKLVEACHKNSLRVTATPYANSFSLALALSGFNLEQVLFLGHPPKGEIGAPDFWKKMAMEPKVQCFHDAPYRLGVTIKALEENLSPEREVFVALNLGLTQEQCYREKIKNLKHLAFPKKAEFVIVVGP